MPVAVPGAAVSPGARICILANTPALTAIAGLVLLVLLPSVTSETVSVWLPTLLRVTLNEAVVKQHLLEPGYFEPTPEWNKERSADRLWS